MADTALALTCKTEDQIRYSCCEVGRLNLFVRSCLSDSPSDLIRKLSDAETSLASDDPDPAGQEPRGDS